MATENSTQTTIPHASAFDALRNSHGLILGECEEARISTALQGVATILAVLQQRETDAESNACAALFGPVVAQGLLAAAATCTEFAQNIIDDQCARAECGTTAYKHLTTARAAVESANAERRESLKSAA